MIIREGEGVRGERGERGRRRKRGNDTRKQGCKMQGLMDAWMQGSEEVRKRKRGSEDKGCEDVECRMRSCEDVRMQRT